MPRLRHLSFQNSGVACAVADADGPLLQLLVSLPSLQRLFVRNHAPKHEQRALLEQIQAVIVARLRIAGCEKVVVDVGNTKKEPVA